MQPQIRTSLPGPRSRALTARSDILEPPSLTGGIKNPNRIFWASGSGANVTDVDGNIFLDMTSAFGVSLAGHGATHIGSALSRQSARLLHSMGDLFPSTSKISLIEALLEVLSLEYGQWQVTLGTSGSDVVELALKLAHTFTGRDRFLAFDFGYHGQALGALPIMGQIDLRKPFTRLFSSHVDFISFPDSECTDINHIVERLIEKLEGEQYAAVVLEPIQGLSGYRFLHRGAVAFLNSIAARYGTLVVLDEIFSGFWRAGHALYSRHLGLDSDIVCVGKALGGGVPISALIAKPAIWASLANEHGLLPLHGGTFAGDPLCCEGALANLRWYQRPDVLEKVSGLGARLRTSISSLERKNDPAIITRGEGLLWALEVRMQTGDASSLVSKILYRCLANGVIFVQTGFPRGNVIGIAPPAVIAPRDLDFALDVLSGAIKAELSP